jgi:hypothetical protein
MTASKWDLSNEDWIEAADQALQFIEDPDARGLILFRFESQYLPAVRKARRSEHLWRAWNAFHQYLTARRSSRKFFSLSDEEADRAISTLAELLDLPPYAQP